MVEMSRAACLLSSRVHLNGLFRHWGICATSGIDVFVCMASDTV